ncbi:hypothetical protein GCK32_006301 [Trichostrongylus colubriformis]|uniref:Uncharacterized protein n=1 Tax=Trichostrongylus colubriformis TaxID=6319 RepID=A0AAN8IQT5_TRICO
MPWQTTTMFLVSLAVSAVRLDPANGKQPFTTEATTFFIGEKLEVSGLKNINGVSGRSIGDEVQNFTNQMRMLSNETAKGTKHFSELAARIIHEANMRMKAEQEMRKAITIVGKQIRKFVSTLRHATRVIERTERNAVASSKEADLYPNASSERLLRMGRVFLWKLREISEELDLCYGLEEMDVEEQIDEPSEHERLHLRPFVGITC